MSDVTARWRAVGGVLAVGAAYDGVFALAILLAPRPAAALLRLPFPADPVFLYLNGVLLAILAGVYAAAARDPRRYGAVAPVSAVGRVAGFGLFAWAWSGGRPAIFLALGLADLAIGVVTLALWRRAAALSD
jgi:hypothetical protein